MTLTVSLMLVLATPTFPQQLSTLSGGPVPDCAVCHQGGVTGRGTVTTAFGAALRERGLAAGDEASLSSAWASLEGVDSDGDGASDRDELTAGTDPNAGGTSAPLPVPEYGCTSTASAPLLGLLLAWSCRRTRQRSQI